MSTLQKQKIIRFGILFLTTLVAGTLEVSASNLGAGLTSANISESAVQEISKESFLESLVSRSDLIFKGKLVDVSEALSIEAIPYTFVTYDVQEVVAGNYFYDTITLKYVGGTFPNGNQLSASNAPQVKLGEESILMVQQSIDTGCDFVDCENGRFTIEDGRAIAANESALVVNDKGELSYITLPERSGSEYQKSAVESNIPNFISHLKKLDKASLTQRSTARVAAANINKNVPFQAYSALTQAGEAPQEIDNKIKHVPQKLKGSEFDRWEVEQLEQNSGNPLLTKNYQQAQD